MRSLVCGLLLLISFATTAQTAETDSLLPIASTSQFRALADACSATPAATLFWPLSRYARSELAHERLAGGFRRVQEPEHGHTTTLTAEGITQLNGWRLSGRFAFERQRLDSIRWSLRVPTTHSAPFYLASEKPGNWDNQTYRLGGSMARRILKNRFVTGLGIDYAVGNYFRYNDPRPEVLSHTLRLTGSVGWAIKTGTVVALHYGWGYGSERTTVQFGNEKNQQGQNTPFTVYDVLGYGFLREATLNNYRLQKQQERIGMTAFWKHGGRYLLTAERESSTEIYTKEITVFRNPVGDYRLTTYRARLLRHAARLLRYSRYQSLLIETAEGRDQNYVIVQGNNYLYSRQFGRAEAGWLTTSGSVSTDVMAYASYQAIRQVDGTTLHRVQTRRWVLGGSLRQYRPLGSSTKFGVWRWLYGAGLETGIDGGSTLQVPPQQENRFSQSVVYGDFLYAHTQTGQATVSLGLDRALPQKARVRLLLETTYLRPFSTNNSLPQATFRPLGHRATGSLSLQFFY